MFERTEVPETLLRRASRQGGVLSRAQVLAEIGRTPMRRLLGTGAWIQPARGIIVPAPSITDQGRLWAGVLLGGPGAALGGWAALARAQVVPVPRLVTTWTPPDRRPANRPGWVFSRDIRGRLGDARGSLPAIRLDDALLDIAADCTLERWVGVLAGTVREGLVRVVDVATRSQERPRLPNAQMVRDVLRDYGGIESTLEWVYRRDVERAHGLPVGLRQVSTVGPWRHDVRYERWRLAVELDGRHHLRRVLRDLEKDNEHVIVGIGTLRYGTVDVRTRPCKVADQVARALRARGWDGHLSRCPLCTL